MKRKVAINKRKSIKQKPSSIGKLLLLIVTPFVSGALLYILLINVPVISKKLIELTSSGSNNSVLDMVFSSLAIIISIIFCFAIGLYLYVDYRAHSVPLKIADPDAPYTINHHTKLVILPLIRYKKKKISFVIFYPVMVILILGFSISASLSKVLAAIPSVNTGVAGSITHGSASLSGESENTTSNNITSRGFEYGLDNTYGSTLSEAVNSNSPYAKFGELQDGHLLAPRSITTRNNQVYVGDTVSKIIKFSNTGTYLSKFGSFGDSDGQFRLPTGVAVDSSGNSYVVDGVENDRVQKFDSNGSYVSKWGTSGSGESQFNNPVGAAIDSSNNVYVADSDNHRIQKFDSSGNFLYALGWGVQDGSSALQVCTSGCQTGLWGSGDGQFYRPWQLTIDSSGNLYVSDSSNNRIQKFDSSGNYLTKWGTGGTGDGQFFFPVGIAVDSSNNVYVSEGGNRVQKFTSTGTFITKWGPQGTSDGQFFYPFSLTIDSSNNVYVGDWFNSRVQKFTSTGTFITKWGMPGSGELRYPEKVAIDQNGDVYVAGSMNYEIKKFDSDGNFILKVGTGSYGTGDGQLGRNQGIAIDSVGNLIVADDDNRRVQIFDSNGNFISKFGSPGSAEGQFSSPEVLTTDNSDNIYVIDQNRIQKFDPSGTFISAWGWGVQDGSSAYQICTSGCQAGMWGSGDGQLEQASDIVVDNGFVYVADTNQNRIQKFDTDGNFVTKWGTYGSGNGELSMPKGIDVDSNGDIYVSDQYNNRIQKFDNVGNYITKWGEEGSGDGQFNGPTGLAISNDDSIYVTDSLNHRVQRFSEPVSDVYSLSTSKLICETTYHFRAFAVNEEDTGYGSDQTFTTDSCAGATVPSEPINLTSGIPYSYSSFIFLNWEEPEDFGGKAIDGYLVEYKKSSDSTWLVATTNSPGLSEIMSRLDPATSYDFRVAAINEIGTGPYSQVYTVSTFTSGGTYTISECEDLHLMDQDPLGTFSLDQDVNCAGYSDFTVEQSAAYGIEGFIPVGIFLNDFNGNFGFQGSLNGNGHKITNLKISDESGLIYGYGLFGVTTGASISNLQIKDIDYDVDSEFCGHMVGGVVAYAIDTTFDNVSTTGNIDASINRPVCQANYGLTSMRVGGIVATAQTGNTLTRVYSSATINVDNNSDDFITVGGLVGVSTAQGGKETLGYFQNSQLPKNLTAGHLEDLAVMSVGSVIGVNSNGEKVQKYDQNGTLVAEWKGSPGRGRDGDFWIPRDITTDTLDNVYVADTGNNRIQKFDSDGDFISAWGWGVQDGSSAYQVCASDCRRGYDGYEDGNLYRVEGIATDSNNNVYATRVDGKIQKFDSDGNFLDSWYFDADEFASDWYALDIEVDSLSNIYVAGGDDDFRKINIFDSSGTPLDSWDITGDINSNISGMSISIDSSDNVYIDDHRNNHIQKFDSSGILIDEWGEIGAGQGQFFFAGGIANDAAGNVYIGDTGNNRIQKLDSSGVFIDEWNTDNSVGQRSIGYGDRIGLDLTDAYFNGNITVDGDNTLSIGTNAAAGLIGTNFMGSNVTNTYVAGSITATSNAGKTMMAGTTPSFNMGVDYWGFSIEELNLRNSFVVSSLNNDSPAFGNGYPEAAKTLPLGVVASDSPYVDGITVVDNNYYDIYSTEIDDCYYFFDMSGPTFGPNTEDDKCLSVNSGNSTPNYFKFTRFNEPYTQWNFGTLGNNWADSIWRTNYNGLPTFGINTPPDPPILSTGVPDTVSIPVSWTPPAEVGGRPIIDYLLQYRVQGSNTWITYPHAPSTTTNYTLTGLVAGTIYEIQVAAINEIGASQFVLGATATTSNATPPPPPPPPSPTPSPTPTPTPSPSPSPTPNPTTESPVSPDAGGELELPSRPDGTIGVKKDKKLPIWASAIPFFFMSLLLLVALMYALKSWKEYRRAQALKALIARYRLTSENIQAFLQITAHYLNTPVAIMQNAMELFISKKTLPESVTKVVYDKLKELGKYVATIQNSAQSVLSPSDSSSSAIVGAIDYPKNKSLLNSKEIWLPLIAVAVALSVLDSILIFTGGYKVAELRLLNHALFFGLGAVVLLIAVYLHNRQKELHQEQQNLLATEQALHEQQTILLGTTGESLNRYYTSLSKSSEEFRHINETKVYFNGLAMLGRLSNSLGFTQSLVMIQSNLPQQSLSQTIDGVLTELQPQIDQKQITLTKDVSSDAVIQALPEHASYLVKSLLENAIKFSPDGSTIQLSASGANGGTLLKIVDHGKGLSAQELEKLFQPFSRGTSTEVYDTEGLGLGLYNSKLLVEQLSGKLSLSHTKPNGITAEVSLPKLQEDVLGQFGQVIKPHG